MIRGCRVGRAFRVLSRLSVSPVVPVLPVDVGFRVTLVFHAVPLLPGYCTERVHRGNRVSHGVRGYLGFRGCLVLVGSRGGHGSGGVM